MTVTATNPELDTPQNASAPAIRPSGVDVPEEALTDLRRRRAATHWPERETVPDRIQGAKLRSLEGRQVSVALADGSRIDDCELVSAGRREFQKLWLFINGMDTFLSPVDVIAVWESPSDRPAAA